MKFVLHVLLIYCVMSALTQASQVQELTVKKILSEAPCKEKSKQVIAYLNASKHGLWISDSVGAVKTGMPLVIENNASDPSIKRLLNYAYKPQVYLNNTFRGTFYGVIVCSVNNKTKSYFRINKVNNIKISPIRDSARFKTQ